jgi:hypothetical protein
VKVGLFTHASETLPIEPLLRTLSESGIEASAYRVRPDWTAIRTAQIRDRLSKLTHFVLWADRRLPPADWCALITGYAVGTGTRLFVLAPPTTETGAFLDGFEHIEEPERLAALLIGGREDYEGERRRDAAREELIASGFALTERTFLEAVGRGNEAAVRDFLILGYSPDTRDSSGLAALFLAVRSGNADLVRLLVDYGATVNEQSGGRGTSPLMEAAGTGQTTITKELLEAGADPDMVNGYGQSAAILAASEGHTGTLRLLLEWNARTDLVDHLGMTALAYAELFRHADAAAEIRDRQR